MNSSASIHSNLRLSATLGTHGSLWYELQMSYDMWRDSSRKRPGIERFDIAAWRITEVS